MELEPPRRLTKEQFDLLAREICEIVGDKLKMHEDGDSEGLLFKG